MHGNSYIIPGARGLVAVHAEASATAEMVVEALGEFKANLEKFKRDHKGQLGDLGGRIDKLAADMLEIEQRFAGDGSLTGHGAGAGRSPGVAIAADLIKNPGWATLADGTHKEAGFTVDAFKLLNVQASITYDQGGLNVKENVGIKAPQQRNVWLRDRFMPGKATGGSVEWSRETSDVNNAADVIGSGSPFVHEGADKPESTLEWELVDAKIPTIATWVEASRQILSDVAELGMMIDKRLRYFLEVKLEQQLVAGSGAGAQMKGITHTDNHVAFTPTSGDTGIDSISRALGQLADTYEAIPDLLILSNTSYRGLQRSKAVDSGVYLWGGPGGADVQTCWEIPIHKTPAMTVGKFAVLDSLQYATFRMREDARIDVGYRNAQFTQNLVTILGELRALLTVERPTVCMYGSLTL